MEHNVNQLFDQHLVFEISIASAVAYLMEAGYETEESLNYEKIEGFMNHHLPFITEQVVKGGKGAEEKEDDNGD